MEYGLVDESPHGLLVNGERSLTVGVDLKDIFYVARELQEWLHQKARVSLLAWLDSLAENRGLKFNRIFVRNQATRWGICSEKRNISLNRNLLLISRHLSEYVLHHELAHLNHSRRFWSSFTDALPNCRELRSELMSLDPDDMPLWAAPVIDKL